MDDFIDLSGDYNKAQLERKVLSIIKALELKDKTVLDVACGDASYHKHFEHYMGVDDSPENIMVSGADVVLASPRQLPFSDKNFDVVMCISSIHNFSDYKKVLFEMKRVSRENVVIALLKKTKNFNEISKYIEENFVIRKILEEQKDLVFICTF